jgi:phosphoribosylformylglycinamidine (FGAM) synthase-like amidotransferase family enzyme
MIKPLPCLKVKVESSLVMWEKIPNGSRNLIAGVTNERGNIVGLDATPRTCNRRIYTGPTADGLGFLYFRSESVVAGGVK